MRWLWLLFGLLALALGIIGAALPLIPTTPFVLLAAFCFARSSRRLHAWLLAHKHFGPLIVNWRDHGAISRRGKLAGTSSLIAVFVVSLLLDVSMTVLVIQAVALSCSGVFILTRPDPPHER